MAQRVKPIGPFADAAKRIDDFSYNLFSSFLIAESIEKLQQITEEYEEMLQGDDEIAIRDKKREVDACQASFYIAANIMHGEDNYQ